MGAPPQLTPEERAEALAKAKASRQHRATIKAQVKDGKLSINQVLQMAESDEVIAKMRVLELVESMSGVGKVRGKAILEKLNISLTRRLQGLGKHQMKDLIAQFSLPALGKRGKLIVLSGPGGVGKSTVAAQLKISSPFFVSVSATTRSPRFNERDGVDYFYMSDEEFDAAIASDHFLEWASFAEIGRAHV